MIKLQTNFWIGAREGFRAFLPLSIGLIPWALVTGIAMMSAGFTIAQAIGMNMLVYAGVAQLGTLPLIMMGAPIWLIVTTALVLNLRFVIFSAAIANGFRGVSMPVRWLSGYLLIDGVFVVCLEKMLANDDKQWRLGYYLAPSVWSWLLWQVFMLVGVLAANSIPKNWSLEFMSTIALMILLVPMVKLRPMLVAAASAGAAAVIFHGMPLRLGVIVAIVIGIVAGFMAERMQSQKGSI
jgi:predicted branched-subunit amino acid permease